MITFDEYQKIMTHLNERGIQSRRIDSVKNSAPETGDLFLKHDVENRLDRAVRIAAIEAETGHLATYYVQGDLIESEEGKKAVQTIAKYGHEIAYHYDVLDAMEGDYPNAIREFERYLTLFETVSETVNTVCPHGNPTKSRRGWSSNKDFFRSAEVRKRHPNILDIVVDFPTVFPEGVYLSDAGFSLRVIEQIATNDQSNTSAMNDGVQIGWDRIEALADSSTGIVVSIHPHRLQKNAITLRLQRVGFSVLKRTYMATSHLPFVRATASRFYKLTRKF